MVEKAIKNLSDWGKGKMPTELPPVFCNAQSYTGGSRPYPSAGLLQDGTAAFSYTDPRRCLQAPTHITRPQAE